MRDVRTLRFVGLVLLSGMAAGCFAMEGAVVASAVEAALCHPFSNLDGNASFDKTSEESIAVFGVSKIYAMVFLSGRDDGVSWHRDRDRARQSASVMASDGFVVARLNPRPRRYAIARAALEPGATDCYTFPHASSLLVFDAPPGQVTYFGGLTVEYKTEGGSNAAVLREDPSISKQQAIAFLARRHPGIKGEVVTGRTEWVYKK